MPTKTRQDVTYRTGETRPIEMTILDEDGLPVDVSSAGITYRIARHGRKTAPYYLVDLDENSPQISVTGGDSNVVRYDPGSTDLILPGTHTHALRVNISGNQQVVLVGTFKILDDITD